MVPTKASRYIANTALAYYPNASVTSKNPQFIAGSNVMTSTRGYAERRPGFPVYTADVFVQDIKRFYTWQLWSSAYFVMLNEAGGGYSAVYKQRVGTDATFQLLHSDATSTNPFDFVTSNNYVYFGNGVDMMKYSGTAVTKWGITAPAAALTVTPGAGALTTTKGYKWEIAWENSTTGHVSSPSPVSANTTLTAQNAVLTGNTTTDAQVDFVRIFRTLDGGTIYFQVARIAYATWTASGYTDSMLDATLSQSTIVAPLQNQNNRPPAAFGPVWFANRIWVFNGETLYYSNYEEQVLGIEEESFASTNQRSFGAEIQALGLAGEYLLIFTAGAIYRIYGDSLATFRMDTLSKKAGTRNRATVCSNGGIVAWLDTTNIVRISDGTNIKEISYPIRPDIAAIAHATAAMAFYDSGTFHWLVLLDGGEQNKLRVFDTDTEQWMVPWPITGVTAVASGETAAGTQQLFLGRSKKPLALSSSQYQDEGVSYTASFNTNLWDITNEPSEYGIVEYVGLETNAVQATTVKYITDDDPATATYLTISQVIDAPNRTQGTNLVEKWYWQRSPSARRASIQVNWAAANTKFCLFGFVVGYNKIA